MCLVRQVIQKGTIVYSDPEPVPILWAGSFLDLDFTWSLSVGSGYDKIKKQKI